MHTGHVRSGANLNQFIALQIFVASSVLLPERFLGVAPSAVTAGRMSLSPDDQAQLSGLNVGVASSSNDSNSNALKP